MVKYLRFYVVTIAATLLPLSAIGLFNAAADPYSVFNSPTISGFNQTKPERHDHERLFKAAEITRVKPRTIFLGTSRTRSGLNPTHPALQTHQPVYNLAIAGANMYEVRRYFQHALTNQPTLKKVIIGIDFFSFNGGKQNTIDFSEDRLEKTNITLKDALNVTLSVDALQSSINTVFSNARRSKAGVPYLNGMGIIPFPTSPVALASFTSFLERDPYVLSQDAFDNFQYIVKACQESNIELIVFISPTHVTELENVRVAGNWSLLEQWKRQVVKIAPVWDFSGYNSITTELYTDKQVMKNYVDSSHYTREVGNLILDRLLNYDLPKVPFDFGVLITPANVESHLTQINLDREIWAKKNIKTVQLIQTLKIKSRDVKK